MDKFYCYRRDNGIMGFYPQSGSRVKNEFGLTLYVYHSNESYDKDKTWWYVVEERTGMSFGRGHTRTEAIRNALTAIETQGIKLVNESIELAVEKNGLPPQLRPTYL